jgi:hypothetical protein
VAQQLLNTNRTIVFSGAKSSSEKVLPQGIVSYSSCTEPFSLSARDSTVIFTEIKKIGLYDDFELNLQKIHCAEKDTFRLSGWISLTKLKNIISQVDDSDIPISAVLRRLGCMFEKWPSGIDIVCYEGNYNAPKPVLDERALSYEDFQKFLLVKALLNDTNSPRFIAKELCISRGQVRLWEKFDPPPNYEKKMAVLHIDILPALNPKGCR